MKYSELKEGQYYVSTNYIEMLARKSSLSRGNTHELMLRFAGPYKKTSLTNIMGEMKLNTTGCTADGIEFRDATMEEIDRFYKLEQKELKLHEKQELQPLIQDNYELY